VAGQFRDDVSLIATSLKANKARTPGLFYVERLLRRIDTFRISPATLDVREHASVLHAVVARASTTRVAGRSSRERRDGSPRPWRRIADRSWSSMRSASATSRCSMPSLQGRHRYGPDAIGYFIVSGGQRRGTTCWRRCCWRAGPRPTTSTTGEVALDLAPQFETAEGARHLRPHAAGLLADPLYRRHLDARGRRQCVLSATPTGNKQPALRLALP